MLCYGDGHLFKVPVTQSTFICVFKFLKNSTNKKSRTFEVRDFVLQIKFETSNQPTEQSPAANNNADNYILL